MVKVQNIREYFLTALKNEEFVIDKTGQKTIEIIGASFVADEPAIFGTPNQEYIDTEIAWYNSKSTNINDIYDDGREPPKAWQYTADKHGNINSNYGHLIYSNKYCHQFDRVSSDLMSNPDGRRSTMVYTRPTIWNEYDEAGKSDFICTNAVNYYMRNNQIHSVVQMRSNDVIFGYRNDYAWQDHVLEQLVERHNWRDPDNHSVTKGSITWQVGSLHVYERHFHLVK